MHQNNVFTVAKRNLEGQDMIYQAIKFTNNVWALTELKIQPGNPNITVILRYNSRLDLKYLKGQTNTTIKLFRGRSYTATLVIRVGLVI